MSVRSAPTLAGFQWFIASIMAIDPLYLPPDSPVIGFALASALAIVNPALRGVPCGPVTPGVPPISIYMQAVYNLAGSNVINFAQDQSGRDYFVETRRKLGIAPFQPGIVASTGDQATSVSLLNPEFMKNLTLANLQQLKDPYGRAYLQIAQAYGPTIVGLS